MANILVTGGAGFIGSHVAHELLAHDHTVMVLDDMSGGYIDNVPLSATFFEASITDHAFIDHLFSVSRFDYVFHLAAYAAEGLSHFIRRFNYENNLIGSINLINATVNHGVKHFVFTSSMAVYGSQQVPYRETMRPEPEDPYGIAKASVERELAIAHSMFGLDYTIFRPHNVYGERQNIGDPYRNVIGIFMNQIMRGEPMTIFGDGEQVRAFSYISDIAPVIARAIEVPEAKSRIFNIGGETPITINQLAGEVAVAMNASEAVVHLPFRTEVKTAFSDHSARREVFGDYAPVTLWAGLVKMAKWAKQRGPMDSTKNAAIEIAKNLPGKWVR